MTALLRDVARGVLDLVLAPVCVGCGGPIPPRAPDRLVCAACWARARPLPLPRCDRCWMPLPLSAPGTIASCRLCPELRPAVRAVRSVYLLDDVSKPIVHALKYRGWYAVAKPMGRRMAEVPLPQESEEEIDLVVPVPISPTRLRERGYNQAALLAAEIGRIRGWNVDDKVLSRDRSRGSQTTLHPSERRANVAGAFRVGPRQTARIAARHVLLIDDVWTTGATALACCDALLAVGARAVSVLTFGRALPELDRTSRRVELARHS
jgi:ComF family protein